MRVDHLRVVGSAQTNGVMAAELVRIAHATGLPRPPTPKREGLGQLVLPFDEALARAAVGYARTVSRVARDLYRSSASRLEALYDELRRDVAADDRNWWKGVRSISVEVRHVESFPAGPRQVVGTVKNAILDALDARGHRLEIDAHHPERILVARVDAAGDLVLSLDLGHGSLSQRGWRADAGDAPLREHLAAVMLMEARFDPRKDVLIDPMCGSGTIVIEAALSARAMPRPLSRAAAALTGPACTQPLFPAARPLIIGRDHDLKMLAMARDNGRAASVNEAVRWQRGDARELTLDDVRALAADQGHVVESGLIIGNPPYGERLDRDDDEALMALYRDLGRACAKFPGWRSVWLCAHPGFERVFAGRQVRRKPLANGALRAYLYTYQH